MFRFKTRHFILSFFVLTNLYGLVYFAFGGKATKSAVIVSDDVFTEQLISFSILMLTLFVIYFLFYKVILKIRVKKLNFNLVTISEHWQNQIGFLILVIMFVSLYILKTQGSAAGQSDEHLCGFFGLLSAFFQIQSLALVYLVSCSRTKVWKVTFYVYILYNILLGWTSFIFLLVFLYLFDKEQYKNINWVKVFLFLGGLFLVYPGVYYLRFIFRVTGGSDVNFEDINILALAGANATIFDYLNFAYFQLIERLQQFYLNFTIWSYRDVIIEQSSKNVFYTGASPNQQAIPAVDYLMEEEGVSR